MSTAAATAAHDAALAVLEAPIDSPVIARQTAIHSAAGTKPRQRGRTGSASSQFNAKHPRTVKGRVGGGEFRTKTDAERQQTIADQKALKAQGVYQGAIDGIAGPQTLAAIKAFQVKFGLPQTGKLDERTRLTLDNPPPLTAATVQAQTAAALAPSASSRSSTGTASSGTASSGTASTLNVKDPNAVRVFQKQHGLKVDGIVGPETKGAMEALGVNQPGSGRGSRSSATGGASAGTRSSRSVSNGLLRQGAGMDRKRGNGDVKRVQTALEDLGYDLGEPGADGKFGPITTKAVKAFQREHGLAPDGVIGRHTRRLLDMLAAKSASRRGKQNAPLSLDQEAVSSVSEAGLLAAAAAEQVLEVALRGASRHVELKRLPDGTFAPKGLGRVLQPGDRIRTPSGRVGQVGRSRGGHLTFSARGESGRISTERGADREAAAPNETGGMGLQATLDRIDKLGLNEWPPKTKTTEKVLGKAVDTQQLHAPNGVYTAARKKLHDQIISDLLAGHTKQPGKPQALFMAGGAASGKSRALKTMSGFQPADAVEINPDDIKERLPEYQQLLKLRDRYAATAAHEESADLAARLMQEAMDRGLNVVVDGTGDSKRGKFAKKLQRMNDAGYDVRALYVTVPTEVAIARAVKRAEKTGRFVPVPELRTQHRNVSAWFEDVAKLPFLKGLELLDTSTPEPATLASAKGGRLTIKDRNGYTAFRGKTKDA